MTAVPDVYASGQKLGRYQLIRRLAVGGMAEIYLARLPGIGHGLEGFEKVVVLKRILPQHALDPELLRMFLDEARLSATLTHPHVTEVYDVGTDGEAPFFAMEYVLGANLRQLMQANARAHGGPLPLELALGIVAAAAAGLHYAHEKHGPGGEPLHIVHRDVSPSNVLVSYDGAVKVSDFGIAKWAHQRTQTQEGALKGKFGYMSPEQCRGKPLDARSDVFALGTILYELTTGEAPFQAESDFEILNKIVGGPPEPPRWTGERAYPAALSEIVMRALAREPADRTPTAQALQVELETFARQERLEVSTVALGAFMHALFAEELTALREAQRTGKSLADHLAEREARRPETEGPRTATDAFAVTRRAGRGKRRALAAASLGVVLAATLGLASIRDPAADPTPASRGRSRPRQVRRRQRPPRAMSRQPPPRGITWRRTPLRRLPMRPPMSPAPPEVQTRARPDAGPARASRGPRPPRDRATSPACTRGIPIHPFRRNRFISFFPLALLLLAAEARAADVDAAPRDDEVGAPMKPDARALYDRGLAHYQSKDYANAVAAFEAGFALEPRREFLFANAQARRLSGDCRGAVPLYQRFLEMAPPPVQASATHIALARCAQQMAAERPAPPVFVTAPAPPVPAPPWTHDRWGAVLLGAGVVGLGVGVGFLVASFAALPDANAQSHDDYAAAHATADSRHTLAVLGLVGGGALAAAGVARYAWVRHERRAAATLTIVPGGVALEGRF